MIGLALLALMAAPEDPGFDRLLQCQALHDQWQWDLHNAHKTVYRDSEWFLGFRDKLRAAGAAQGIDRYKIAELSNALGAKLKPALTPEQTADWEKCQAETGWKPNADGATIDF